MMYRLKIKFSWGEQEEVKTVMTYNVSPKNTMTLVFADDLEYIKGLILDMSDEKQVASFTFENENCQLIYPHCRMIKYDIQEDMIAIVVNYGTTN